MFVASVFEFLLVSVLRVVVCSGAELTYTCSLHARILTHTRIFTTSAGGTTRTATRHATRYVAHTYSIDVVFLGLGGLFLVLNNVLLVGGWGERERGADGGGVMLADAKTGRSGETAEKAAQAESGLELAKQGGAASRVV